MAESEFNDQRGLRYCWLFFLLCSLLSWAQCHANEPVQVVDAEGSLLVLPAPATRIVALAPHLAENLFSIGAGHTLVGTSQYSDYPPAASRVPRVGGFNSLSLERIVALQPELVLAWGSGNSAAIVERLRGLGIAVYVDEIRRLDDLQRSLLTLGQLSGAQKGATQAAAQLTRTLDELRRTPGPDGGLRVFYQVWHAPLQSVGGAHLISELISHCGGQNIFSDSTVLAPRVSMETVLARDPQLIIVGDGQDAAASNEEPQALPLHWREHPSLSAVQHGAVHHIHPDLLQRPTLRLLQGMRQLCALISE